MTCGLIPESIFIQITACMWHVVQLRFTLWRRTECVSVFFLYYSITVIFVLQCFRLPSTFNTFICKLYSCIQLHKTYLQYSFLVFNSLHSWWSRKESFVKCWFGKLLGKTQRLMNPLFQVNFLQTMMLLWQINLICVNHARNVSQLFCTASRNFGFT